jgi:hypothetical protein
MPAGNSRAYRGHRGTQAATNAARESTTAAEETPEPALGGTDELMEDVAGTVSRTADAAVDITQRVADQGRDVMWLGMRAAAGMNGRLADVGYGSSHRLLQQAARMMEIYSDASEATAANLQRMFASYLAIGRGMQQMQRAWFGLFDRAVNDSVHRPQELLRSKSLVEAATTQRDLYIEAVERTVEANVTLLQIAERVARDAIGPLQGRERAASHG